MFGTKTKNVVGIELFDPIADEMEKMFKRIHGEEKKTEPKKEPESPKAQATSDAISGIIGAAMGSIKGEKPKEEPVKTQAAEPDKQTPTNNNKQQQKPGDKQQKQAPSLKSEKRADSVPANEHIVAQPQKTVLQQTLEYFTHKGFNVNPIDVPSIGGHKVNLINPSNGVNIDIYLDIHGKVLYNSPKVVFVDNNQHMAMQQQMGMVFHPVLEECIMLEIDEKLAANLHSYLNGHPIDLNTINVNPGYEMINMNKLIDMTSIPVSKLDIISRLTTILNKEKLIADIYAMDMQPRFKVTDIESLDKFKLVSDFSVPLSALTYKNMAIQTPRIVITYDNEKVTVDTYQQ